MVNKKLDTGDYSIEGLENVVCVERKKSVSEIAQNLTQPRFAKELERMDSYKYKFIICEFDWADVINFPYGSGLPKSIVRKIRVKGKFLINGLMGLGMKYGVHIHYAGNTKLANNYCISMFKYIWALENSSDA